MQALLEICCGLDVHKDSVVACIMKDNSSDSTKNKGEAEIEIKTFSTLLSDLENLKNWIIENNCHHVAMESTGVYWYPVYETLVTAFNGDITLIVTNACHMRNVSGKKTDNKDAQWIDSLLRAGLLNGSFIPESDVRELRQLTRYRRNIVQDITQKRTVLRRPFNKPVLSCPLFLAHCWSRHILFLY